MTGDQVLLFVFFFTVGDVQYSDSFTPVAVVILGVLVYLESNWFTHPQSR